MMSFQSLADDGTTPNTMTRKEIEMKWMELERNGLQRVYFCLIVPALNK